MAEATGSSSLFGNMKPLNRQILSLAVPSIIANITTPLLSLMDVAIVGHMSALCVAAIAVGGTMFNMIYWLFGFLRMGTSGMTAQSYGANDWNLSHEIKRQALKLAIGGGAVLILLSSLIFSGAMAVMEVENETRELADTYFTILIFGVPAVLGTYAMSGWLLGMQRAKAAMTVSIVINAINIVVSLLLVLVFHFGIAGVATGTLVAQWSGFFLSLLLGRRSEDDGSAAGKEQRFSMKSFFKVNFDIFLRTLCIIFVTVWFTRVGSAQGTVMLAVNTLLMQFFTLFSYFIDGFANAGEALCGRETGAGDVKQMRYTVRTLLGWGAGVGLVFTALYMVGGTSLIDLLCSDHQVINASREFMPWVIIIPLVSFAAFTYDGIFIGLTHTRWMLVSMGASTALYFLSYFLLFPVLGNHGLWLSFLVYLLSRGVILALVRK